MNMSLSTNRQFLQPMQSIYFLPNFFTHIFFLYDNVHESIFLPIYIFVHSINLCFSYAKLSVKLNLSLPIRACTFLSTKKDKSEQGLTNPPYPL